MKKILLDTNFMLIPAQFKVDVFAEIERICDFNYKLYILDKSLDELKDIISHQRGKHKVAAVLALQLIKSKKVNIIKTDSDEYVDDIIASLKSYIICTQDKELIQRLKGKKPIPKIITLRQKKYLVLK